MKKRIWIYVSTLMVCMFMGTTSMSAQSCNTGYGYTDDVVVVTNYGDGYSNNNRRRKRDRRDDRRWRASILDRAYAIARADGHICKRERRELRRLEQDLGLYKQGRKRRY